MCKDQMPGNVLSQVQLANPVLSHFFYQEESLVHFKGYVQSLLKSFGHFAGKGGKVYIVQNSLRMSDLHRVHDKEPNPTIISVSRYIK